MTNEELKETAEVLKMYAMGKDIQWTDNIFAGIWEDWQPHLDRL